jgi:hypothetical protein
MTANISENKFNFKQEQEQFTKENSDAYIPS